jgi:hypothetical protein
MLLLNVMMSDPSALLLASTYDFNALLVLMMLELNRLKLDVALDLKALEVFTIAVCA